ncbi:deoxyribodipyrimidine photo-lyase [Vibrio sp. TBV020]|uniref:deoxyribodipyrimidine photo-lyase n=1 Tax=Vibrio sp. TBV020 TaxID=3137398 RepID=UPI0038CD5AB3
MKIVWFRRDLRVDDNSALVSAIESEEPVVAVYIATPQTWRNHNHSAIQADLIFRRLIALKHELAELNIPLYYAQVDTFSLSAQLIANLALEVGASSVSLNKEYEFNERNRDGELLHLLSHAQIDVHAFDDKCIFPPGSVKNKQGEYFKVFTPFKRAYLTKLYQLSFVVNKPRALNQQAVLNSELVELFNEESVFDYPREPSEHFPIEREEIIRKLRDFVANNAEAYSDRRDFPAINGTSSLSCYLAIGALSVRQCMARLMHQQPLPVEGGREVWQSELIWREFYQHLIYFEPKLSKGHSFTPWGDNLVWRNNPTDIEAWKQGKTGYPIVDAAMAQLNRTGWMHNRLRMIVASFLVKDLHVDWRIGEEYFMSKLIDGDYAANNGGWQWCASTGCDGQPYFRIFNPVTQGERFDPKGEFVREWLPELRQVPDKVLHKPWHWSESNFLSYPAPIVDHKTEREITLGLYKDAKEKVDGA